MTEEVFYYFVRGQGWVPRLEPLDNYESLLESFQRELTANMYNTLASRTLIPYNDEPIEIVARHIRQLMIQYTPGYWLYDV